jgi:hypothetical protein
MDYHLVPSSYSNASKNAERQYAFQGRKQKHRRAEQVPRRSRLSMMMHASSYERIGTNSMHHGTSLSQPPAQLLQWLSCQAQCAIALPLLPR